MESTKTRRVRVLIILAYMCIDTCKAFFARPGKDGNWRTKTHFDITNIGVFRALEEYIIRNKGAASIDDFFSKDANGRSIMYKKIGKLRQAVADTQTNKKETAYIHCHADQIDLAHNFVKSCKQRLQHWIGDEDQLLQQLGECLYTVQSFYSNTNWVEMYGNVPYEDFGLNDLIDVATPDMDTCKDQANFDSQCKDNTIVSNMLTSGYFHGRGNQKPAKAIGATTGKCSHGGKDDSSRTSIARCGINKESVEEEYSPHNHLHDDAYIAAVKATGNFLIANGTGIVDLLGVKYFDSLFHVKRQTSKSLAIAIDYTSSMSDDIEAVKKTVIKLLTATVGSDNEPADYVLSMFYDPAKYNYVKRYVHGYDMIEKVKNLTWKSGENPDCPELVAAGMLQAIELCRSNSPLLVFTDAPAKDEARMNEVISAANAKNISVSSLLTDQCTRKRSIEKDRTVRSLFFFQQIAEATSGTVYQTDKKNIGTILDGVLEGMFTTGEVMIQSFHFPSSVPDYYITVDKTVTVLKINVLGTTTDNDVSLFYPDGTQEDYTSGKSTRVLLSGQLILSIQDPQTGQLKLHRNVNGDWTVNVTAQSKLKVEVEIFDQVGNGDLVTLQGNPIVGKNYTVLYSVYNLGNNSACNSIEVLDISGNVVSAHNTSQLTRDFDTSCAASIYVPNATFQIRLAGRDDTGHTYLRQLCITYKPTNSELSIMASTDDLVVGRDRSIPYIVTNVGTSSNTYNISIEVSNGYIQGISSKLVNLEKGTAGNGSFILKAISASVILSYTVSVSLVSTSEIQQSLSRKHYVSTIERPYCILLISQGVCRPESLNTANCSMYKWSAEVEVIFSGITLKSIISTVGQAVNLTHRNISGLTNGPLQVRISGDCCSPNLQISAVDQDGFITQCDLSFSDGGLVQSVEVFSINQRNKENNIKLIVLCTCIAFVTIIITVTALFIKYNLKKASKCKV